MSDMITDIASKSAIAAHIENFVAFWSCYGSAPGGEFHNTPEMTYFISGIPYPLFNGVLRANITTTETAIKALVERLNVRRVPAFWWQGPTTEPGNLADILARHGFVFAGNTPGMAVDLQTVLWDRPLPAGLQVKLVNDAELLTSYLRTLAASSGIPLSLHDMLLKVETGGVAMSGAELWRYVGFLNGVPVATSAMVLYAGVAGIYAVSTLPEARNKGIGSALTIVPLRHAVERGYRIATLQASEMGLPIYEKIGFKTVFQFALYLRAK